MPQKLYIRNSGKKYKKQANKNCQFSVKCVILFRHYKYSYSSVYNGDSGNNQYQYLQKHTFS